MIAPDWLNDAVRAFGRQMGLKTFALNDRGTAGVDFENGLRIRFEYTEGALVLSSGVPCENSAFAMEKLFSAVHWAAGSKMRLRAAYFSKAGMGSYIVRLSERDVNVTLLEAAFRELWAATDRLRRAVA